MDRYGNDVLAGDWRSAGRASVARVPADPGLVVELPDSGFVGAVVGVEVGNVHLEDRHGRVRAFPLGPGFVIDGAPATLIEPTVAAPTGRARSLSGSFHVADQRARTARASRLWVEGRHDAELVEKVWGHDLRVEGVVVEYLEGVDHLADRLASFAPTPARRVGVLVDHLVDGSKEARIAAAALTTVPHGSVHIVGHPFVDIWQAVKPARLGIEGWPEVPRHLEWKRGVLAELGLPHDDQADIAHAWQRILSRVRSFHDLEPALLGPVEELIDFVTEA
ncbi:DUF3097 family protein [Microcella sp.]|uniref:DUF3097 family protein n=1 Tax=Microcella sp. TaxID=1913979 RepID=UPI00391AC0EA